MDSMNNEKLLNYYKNKYKDHFSPAILDFKIRQKYKYAKDTYSKSKGVSFETYLANVMKSLSRDADQKGGLLYTSEYSKQFANKVKKEINKQKLLNSEEDLSKIQKKFNLDEDKIHELVHNNVKVSILPGEEYYSSIEVDPIELLGEDIDDKDRKVLETIEKNMPFEKALQYTKMKKTTYYDRLNKLKSKMRNNYLKELKNKGIL